MASINNSQPPPPPPPPDSLAPVTKSSIPMLVRTVSVIPQSTSSIQMPILTVFPSSTPILFPSSTLTVMSVPPVPLFTAPFTVEFMSTAVPSLSSMADPPISLMMTPVVATPLLSFPASTAIPEAVSSSALQPSSFVVFDGRSTDLFDDDSSGCDTTSVVPCFNCDSGSCVIFCFEAFLLLACNLCETCELELLAVVSAS